MRAVLITGGTGSFGHACVEQLLTRPETEQILVFSRDEVKQAEMRQRFQDRRLDFFIGDVRDPEAVLEAVSMPGLDLIIHAAALKRVGTGQRHPREVIRTNVGGAKSVIAAAHACGIPRVIALSTDKAVEPVNVYGRSKAAAEALFLHAQEMAVDGQAFVIVRYGNVIGSRGSVVPLFLEQKDRGELTVTDRRASRFWMPLSQAVETVLVAGMWAPGGSIIVPKIPSALVVDVAQAIAPECPIREIGMADGEKLHEKLIADSEWSRTYDAATGDCFLITRWPLTTLVPSAIRSYQSDDNPLPVTIREAPACA